MSNSTKLVGHDGENATIEGSGYYYAYSVMSVQIEKCKL